MIRSYIQRATRLFDYWYNKHLLIYSSAGLNRWSQDFFLGKGLVYSFCLRTILCCPCPFLSIIRVLPEDSSEGYLYSCSLAFSHFPACFSHTLSAVMKLREISSCYICLYPTHIAKLFTKCSQKIKGPMMERRILF